MSFTVSAEETKCRVEICEDVSEQASRHSRQLRIGKRYLLAITLLLATTFILPGINRGEFHLNVDEAFHATTGLFFADLVRDLPLRHPVDYAYQYYAQYPALGLAHWPPLFHMAEGGMFLLFGPHVIAARIAVLLFALVGLFFWFRLVRDLDNEWTATTSTILLASLPAFLLYEKAVLLELPSVALCIAATFYWMRYLEGRAARSAIWFGIFAGLALLTKQQSIYLAPVCLLTLLPKRQLRLLLRPATLVALAITAGLSVPFYVLCFGIDAKSVKANLLNGIEHVANPFTYYFPTLVGSMGVVLLVLSMLGAVTWYFWKKGGASPIMLLWIIAWYITFTAIATKTPRYIVYCLPPLVYFAVAPLTSKSLPRLLRPIAAALALTLVIAGSWTGWKYQRPYVAGYNRLARQIVADDQGSVVLFDGDLAGNFIFFMRADDPHRRFVVLRKALYVTEVMKQFGSEEQIHSSQDLEQLLQQYGIKYIVIEKNAPIEFESQKILRQVLQTSQFKLTSEIPIQSNDRKWQSQSLLLYENLEAAPPTERMLRLRMLSMSHDIVEPLDAYLKR